MTTDPTLTECLPKSAEEIAEIWSTAHVLVDSSVLLNIYNFSHVLEEKIFEVCRTLGGRFWIPEHVMVEYLKNRVSAISKTNKVPAPVTDLKKALEALKDAARSPYLISLDNDVKDTVDSLLKLLEDVKRHHPHQHSGRVDNDSILNAVRMFGLGDTPTVLERETIFDTANARFRMKTPPGYRDSKKDENSHGDYLVWWQTLKHATKHGVPVIFVTDDKKEDWWEKNGSELTGPRLELIREFKRETGQKYLQYTTEGFLQNATLHLPVAQFTTEEIQNVRNLLRTKELPKKYLDFTWVNDDLSVQEFIDELQDLETLRVQWLFSGKKESEVQRLENLIDLLREKYFQAMMDEQEARDLAALEGYRD